MCQKHAPERIFVLNGRAMCAVSSDCNVCRRLYSCGVSQLPSVPTHRVRMIRGELRKRGKIMPLGLIFRPLQRGRTASRPRRQTKAYGGR